jgi:hypothetical protein
MGRKFCNAIYRVIEKKGKIRCIEDGCDGYILKDSEEINSVCTESYSEDTFFYQCNKNKKHRWEVTKNNLDSRLIFQKI